MGARVGVAPEEVVAGVVALEEVVAGVVARKGR